MTGPQGMGPLIGLGQYNPLGLFDHVYWAEGDILNAVAKTDMETVVVWPDEVGSLDAVCASSYGQWHAYDQVMRAPAMAMHEVPYVVAVSPVITQPRSLVVVCSDWVGMPVSFNGLSSVNNKVRIALDGTVRAGADTEIISAAGVWSRHRPHCLVFVAAGASSKLYLDGTLIQSGNAGVVSLSNIRFGDDTTVDFYGLIAFYGIAIGDITLDPEWPTWYAWADDHYSGFNRAPTVLPYTDSLEGRATMAQIGWTNHQGSTGVIASGTFTYTDVGRHQSTFDTAMPDTEHYMTTWSTTSSAPNASTGPIVRSSAVWDNTCYVALIEARNELRLYRRDGTTTLVLLATHFLRNDLDTLEGIYAVRLEATGTGSTVHLVASLKRYGTDEYSPLIVYDDTAANRQVTGTKVGYFSSAGGESVQPITRYECGPVSSIADPVRAVSCQIFAHSRQAEPSTIFQTVLFDVVFSEAVENFSSGDCVISGSAGPSHVYVTVVDQARYTVSVNGMTGAGDVTLTIPSSSCTSIVQGEPNLSGSHTIAWTAPSGILDDFNRVSLGELWGNVNGGSSIAINTNRMGTTGGDNHAIWMDDMSSVDQWIEYDLSVASSNTFVAILRRLTNTTVASETYYYVGYGNGSWSIQRRVAGTFTSLATAATPDPVAPFKIRVTVQTVGGNVELKAYTVTAGVPTLVLSFTDTSGSRILVGNYLGFRGNSAGGFVGVDNFAAGKF